MPFKDRLKAARRDADVTQQQVADAVGVSPQAVSGWERGESVPETEKLAAISRIVGRPIGWLLDQYENPHVSSEDVAATLDGPAPRMLKVTGYVRADGSAVPYDVDPGDMDQIPAIDKDPPDAVAAKIMGTSLGLFFDRWHVVYHEVRSPVTPDMLGQLCVVWLTDGRVLVKKVQRAGKRFDLYSNVPDEDPIRNVGIESAALVTDIRKA